MEKTTILITEDDEDIREGIKILLESEDYCVVEAENGAQALELLNDEHRAARTLRSFWSSRKELTKVKKRTGILGLIFLAALSAGGVYWYQKTNSSASVPAAENAVFADSIGGLTGMTNVSGRQIWYSGVVEPQRIEKVELTSGMKVKETYVTVGENVDVGTKLFAYDTDEAQDSITKLEIDLENADISIESTKNQIAQLEKEREKASGDTRLSYTTQIMTAENSVKRTEYEKKSKTAELESLKRQLKNAVVKSEVRGVVKTIKKNTDSADDSSTDTDSDETNAYITIMAVGEYRIKGKVNEQNVSQLQEGTALVVHSRAEEALTWKGTLDTIDREKAETNSNDMGNGSETSSKYPFYVTLESSAGLMLGQHVYLTTDQGEEPEGMWLDSYYLITDSEGAVTPYVWAADQNSQLEKRQVTLGGYQEETMKYQIQSGLGAEDYIVFPSEELQVGQPVIKNEISTGELTNVEEEETGGPDAEMAEEGALDAAEEGIYVEADPGDGVTDEPVEENVVTDDTVTDDAVTGNTAADNSVANGIMADDTTPDEVVEVIDGLP